MRHIARLALAATLVVALGGCARALPGATPRAVRPPQAMSAAQAASGLNRGEAPTHLPVGATVPALPMTALDGKPDALENYRGQPVLLVFWATWCPTCTNELPEIEALHVDLASQGLRILAVNASNEKLTKLNEFVQWKAYTFPVFGQYTGASGRDFLINNIPTLYWVGRDGVIRDVHVGELDPKMLRARTKALLESR